MLLGTSVPTGRHQAPLDLEGAVGSRLLPCPGPLSLLPRLPRELWVQAALALALRCGGSTGGLVGLSERPVGGGTSFACWEPHVCPCTQDGAWIWAPCCHTALPVSSSQPVSEVGLPGATDP